MSFLFEEPVSQEKLAEQLEGMLSGEIIQTDEGREPKSRRHASVYPAGFRGAGRGRTSSPPRSRQVASRWRAAGRCVFIDALLERLLRTVHTKSTV